MLNYHNTALNQGQRELENQRINLSMVEARPYKVIIFIQICRCRLLFHSIDNGEIRVRR